MPRPRRSTVTRWQRARQWITEHRLIVTAALAVVLVAVPTTYTVFGAELGDDPVAVRFVVIGFWLLIAAAAAFVASRREERQERQLDWLTKQREEDQGYRIWRDLDPVFRSLLFAPAGIPRSYGFTVYIYDEQTNRLTPYWPTSEDDDVKSFAPGAGATGTAWEQEKTTVVTEDAVSDATYGLTSAQQEFFADYRAVVAEPVLWQGDIIGVLTGISHADDGFFETELGLEAIRDLAAVVGAILGAFIDIPPG